MNPPPEGQDAASDREAFFDLTQDLACIGDLEGNILDVNAAWTDVLGWDRQTLLSKPFLVWIHPDDREATLGRLRDGSNDRNELPFENRVLAQDGSYRWLSWRARTSLVHRRIFAMARDVTRSHALQVEHARLAQIVSSSEDAIIAATPELIITDWNAAAERLYGYTRAEMIGRSVLAIAPLEHLDELMGVHRRILAGERVHHFRTERLNKDGSLIPVSLSFSVIRDVRGEVAGVTSIARDMRARLAHEAEAHEQREALSHTLDAILFLDKALRVVSANRTAATLLAVPMERVVGADSREAVHPDDLAAFTGLHRAATAAGKASGELRLVPHDGAPLNAWVALVASYLPNGRLRGFHAFLRDVTEQKLLESRVLVADRMASIGTLAAGVAHEINNPLAYLLSNLGFVKAELDVMAARAPEVERQLFTELQEALRDAVEGGERVRDIVQDLRTFTRGDTGSISRVRLRDAAELALKMASPSIRERAALKVELRADPMVMGHEGRLTQVVLNLLVNAGQAIRPGAPTANAVTLVVDQVGDRAVVEIRDTGEGIPEGMRTRIFDPFFTTKPAGVGTGMGLSICLQLVTAIGGELTFDSTVGQGTTFWIRLPVAPEETLDALSDGDTTPAHRAA